METILKRKADGDKRGRPEKQLVGTTIQTSEGKIYTSRATIAYTTHPPSSHCRTTTRYKAMHDNDYFRYCREKKKYELEGHSEWE